MYVALSVSLLRHTINTNSRSFSSTKRKIEIRKKTTRKNPSYFIKTKDSRIDRDKNKILGHCLEKKANSSNFKQQGGNGNPRGAKWVWKEISFRIGGGGPTLVLLVAGCVNNDGHTGLLAFLHRIVIYRQGKISRDSVKIEEKYPNILDVLINCYKRL